MLFPLLVSRSLGTVQSGQRIVNIVWARSLARAGCLRRYSLTMWTICSRRKCTTNLDILFPGRMLRTRPGKRHASISGGYRNPGGAEAEALTCLWQAPGFRREVLRICAARPSRRAQARNAQDPRGAAERARPGEKCAGFAFRGQTGEPRQDMRGIRAARPNA